MRLAEWFSRKANHAVPSDDTSSRNATDPLNALCAAIRTRRYSESDRDSLRPLVLAYWRQARDENLTPERMLVQLKQALDDALVGAIDHPLVREATRTQIVKLAIDAYDDGQP